MPSPFFRPFFPLVVFFIVAVSRVLSETFFSVSKLSVERVRRCRCGGCFIFLSLPPSPFLIVPADKANLFEIDPAERVVKSGDRLVFADGAGREL